ncbi:hypothetical protein BDU57DRAFT_177980 [Ampelomyces quisqualis]|uniref:Uncharacterized protein n=1 Tax=Ampelomyces quisqualis TaxID=50730 RepID=A0A6A5QVC6_AMPQU|nr:hypothetical protein BDU57DRAFT_177980 [Ampelomyces quisqualis]
MCGFAVMCVCVSFFWRCVVRRQRTRRSGGKWGKRERELDMWCNHRSRISMLGRHGLGVSADKVPGGARRIKNYASLGHVHGFCPRTSWARYKSSLAGRLECDFYYPKNKYIVMRQDMFSYRTTKNPNDVSASINSLPSLSVQADPIVLRWRQ